jgi:hypothetical protein
MAAAGLELRSLYLLEEVARVAASQPAVAS